MALPVTVDGHQAYGVKITPGTGYRVDNVSVPTGSQPEGIYMVTSSNLYNNQCCMDFGSGEVSHDDTGNGHMNAIYFGSACWFGGCTGSGPWVEADLENGMYSTNTGPNTASNPGVNYPFVSAWEKNNGTSNFTLKYGNATSGGLTTTYSGALPSGYSPMHEEADILLGTGGDNSNGDTGEFFEGAVTSGYPSDATENAVQADLTTAGYAQTSAPTGRIVAGDDSSDCVDDNNGSAANGNKIQMWDLRRLRPRAELDASTATAASQINGTALPGHHRRQLQQRHSHRALLLLGRRQPAMDGGKRAASQPRLRQMPRRPRLQHRQRHPARPVGLQRRQQPAMDRAVTAL